MATGIRKGTASGVPKLSNLGRGDERRVGATKKLSLSIETCQSSNDDKSEELTPLTNPRGEIEYSIIVGPSKAKRKKGKQKLCKEGTAKISSSSTQHAAEDRIKLFVFRLACIEKAASGIGTISFLWATVVLLGGFATSLTYTNFWVVAVIIFAEALRIFNRSHELEWQMILSEPKEGKKSTSTKCSDLGGPAIYPSRHDVESPSISGDDYSPCSSKRDTLSSTTLNKTLTSAGKPREGVQHQQERQAGPDHNYEPQARRTLSRRNISFISESIPYVNHLVKPWVMSRILYILQLVSAIVCVGLSIWRLSVQEFCISDEKGNSTCELYRENVVVSMNLFYSMAVLEATLFLVEKGYFEYRMRYRELLSNVREGLFEGKIDRTVFEKFYYTVYHMSLEGSIFDGLDMSLVAFGIQWLQSDDFEQQLHGAKLLNRFISAKGEDKSEPDPQTADALRRLGTTPGIIERLVEMLSWNAEHEVELLGEIASIVCGLVGYDHNWSRFVAVPGSLDAVVSLLMPHAGNFSVVGKDSSMALSKFLDLQVKGLKILKYLCTSYANSLQIGETRGLLPILVLFIQAQGRSAKGNAENHKPRMSVYRKSLQVLYYLAANKGTSGRTLRQHIAGIVSVLKNLRDIIEDCDEDPYLQLLSMKILHHLALEEKVRCSIGATGGIIRLLFNYFRQNYAVPVCSELEKIYGLSDGQFENLETDRKLKQDRMERSGKVLSRLMLKNKDNCLTLLTLKDKDGKKYLVDVMIASLRGGEGVAVSAAEILRSVLKYADESTRMEIAERSAPIILPNISHRLADTKSGLYEACLGLASRAMESLSLVKYRETMESRPLANYRETPRSGNQFVHQLVENLVKNLKHSPTTSKVPKIRRYSLEAIIAVVERDEYFDYFEYFHAFAGVNLREELEETLDSISEVENFILLSGLLGYSTYTEDIKCLVLRCIVAVDDSFSSRPTLQTGEKVAAAS